MTKLVGYVKPGSFFIAHGQKWIAQMPMRYIPGERGSIYQTWKSDKCSATIGTEYDMNAPCPAFRWKTVSGMFVSAGKERAAELAIIRHKSDMQKARDLLASYSE